ncbi:hypothetical protein IscW_ISCW011113, partial [Ixodes scapularis]
RVGPRTSLPVGGPPRHRPWPPIGRFPPKRSPRCPRGGSLRGRLGDTINIIIGCPVSWGWGSPAPHHQIDPPRRNVDMAARDQAAARLRLVTGMVGPATAQSRGPGRQAASSLSQGCTVQDGDREAQGTSITLDSKKPSVAALSKLLLLLLALASAAPLQCLPRHHPPPLGQPNDD